MNKTTARLSGALGGLMAIILAVMVVLVFGNVVLRYVFNAGITVSEEVSRWLFVWLTFLGAVLALYERAHLGTDMVVSRLGPAGKRLCLIATQVLMLGVTWLMLRGSWEQAAINLTVHAPVSGASMAIFYGAGVVFAVLSLPILLLDLWRTLSGRMGPDGLVMVRESEELGHAEEGPLVSGSQPSRN